MACPDAQTLSMYLDGELAPTARATIEGHLVSCCVCRQQVRRWETIEQALENSLNQHTKSRFMMGENPCARHAELSGYISGMLSPQEQQVVEEHLQRCDACLAEVMALRHTRSLLAQEQLLSPPQPLVQRVRQEIIGTDPSQTIRPMARIVIEIVRSGLKLLESSRLSPTTGLQVTTLQLPAAAFRAAPKSDAQGQAVEILESMGELEVRITLIRDDDATASCSLAVQKQDKPLPQARVTLRKGGRTVYSRKLSPDGQVNFPRLNAGEYCLSIPQEQAETTLILQDPATTQP
jgi:anti-sigma factor RsiW